MSDIAARYIPKEIEEKRLSIWEKEKPFHATAKKSKKGAFSVVIPPPNVTGVLHMGHALNNTLQDILIRYKRMNGFDALWMPGTDHAGIATQNVVEKQLAKEGTSKDSLGREKFMERLWDWKKHHGDTIINQLHKLGSSCDWDRLRFTMDEPYSDAVKEVFVELFNRGLIYQGQYIIHWCPRCQTALSDEEAEHKDAQGSLWHFKYPLKDNPLEFIVVATTRPETMLGDSAVAVHPKDERYKHLIGKKVLLPIVEREIPIIADDFVDRTFGTGAVKVTPAHDPNDFAMGRRHQLAFINIMHPNAVLNENAGPCCGMDRFKARKAVVDMMQEKELLIKIDQHANAVRRCYRCETIVEPYLSKQWFVKMKPLADKALEAFHQGKPTIQPKRWEKVYENWLVDIRDWCISRQIWWGHRIPVWYDEGGGFFVARDEKEAQQQAFKKYGKEVVLTQDPDVLDTWFSSWLWPFATLGWPKDNEDLAYFYPTGTLFTAPEIIFFWVARMVMAGLEFKKEVPFKDVVLHGTVRDAKGRKMSKSLGNAMDPLEIIEEYGADALRFSMVLNSGQDIYISKEKFEIGRNFANKLWNAARFVMMNISQEAKVDSFSGIDFSSLDLPSSWIISRYQVALKDVSAAIEQYRYSEAVNFLYEFFWSNYCDWYLEMIKAKLSDIQTQKVAFIVLLNTLKILHPFVPFVTEELFSYLKDDQDILLTTSHWPVLEENLINEKALTSMNILIDLVGAVRHIRSQWNIKPQDKIQMFVATEHEGSLDLIKNHSMMLEKLLKLSLINVERQPPILKNAAAGVVGDLKFFIPLGELIDVQKEKAKLEGLIEQQIKLADAIEGRLSNESFVKKAPQDVIEKEKHRKYDLRLKGNELRKTIQSLI